MKKIPITSIRRFLNIQLLNLQPVWILMLIWALLLPAAWSQAPAQTLGADGRDYSLFMPAPRDLRLRLERARKAIAEGRYTVGVGELGALLNRADSEDYFEPPSATTKNGPPSSRYPLGQSGQRPLSGLKSTVQDLLGKLPPRGRADYELHYGNEARQLLNQSIATNDFAQMMEVARMYFHTKAGHEAAMLMGRYHLQRQRPLEGALYFRRLVNSHYASARFDPALSLLLATCWHYARLPEEAGKTLMELKRRYPQARIDMPGEKIRLDYADPEQALEWLETIVGPPPADHAAAQHQWALHRGNPARNAQTRGGLPLANLLWKVPTVNDPDDQKLIDEIQSQLADQGVVSTPSLQPLAVGEVLLMRAAPDLLVGVDFESGKRLWEYPFLQNADAQPYDVYRGRYAAKAADRRRKELQQRIWHDAAFGQISSDGKSVYLLDELDNPGGASEVAVRIQRGGQRLPNLKAPRSFNTLTCLDLAKQGKLRWMVGGETGEEEPQLAGVFFLGPPLPLQGKLYILAEMQGEIRLLVLHAETGKLDWSQQLAHVQSLTIKNDRLRRAAGASPSFADGVLICPTSAGAVVAVDIATRTLLWGQPYPTNRPVQRNINRWRSVSTSIRRPGEQWLDATASIARGRVVLTPPESDYLLCYDLLTGQLLWKHSRKKGDLLYVACIHQQNVVLVGEHEVRALRLSDGKESWDEPLDLASEDEESLTAVPGGDAKGPQPSGRGCYAEGHYFLPLDSQELLKIDVQQGRIAERIATENVLGNLVFYQGKVISQTAEWLSVYYQRETLEVQIAQRLAKDPNDWWALARQGELLLQQKRWKEALAVLLQAHKLSDDDEAIRGLAVKTLLMALRQDYESYHSLIDKAEELIREPAQRMTYLRLLAEGARRAGRLEQSLERLLQMADLQNEIENASAGELDSSFEPPLDQQSDSSAQKLFGDSKNWQVRRDRWIASSFATLIREADAAARSKIDDAVQTRLRQILAQSPSSAAKNQSRSATAPLRRFLRYFEFHRTADQARLELARRLIGHEEYLEAETLLQPLAGFQDSRATDRQTAFAAHKLLAQILSLAGDDAAAAAHYDRLRTSFADMNFASKETGRQIVEAIGAETPLGRELGLLEKQRQGKVWSFGQIEVQSLSEKGRSPLRALRPLNIVRQADQHDQRQFWLDTSRNLFVRDQWGRHLLKAALPRSRGIPRGAHADIVHGAVRGRLLLLWLDDDLLAIDLVRAAQSDEPILWSDVLSGRSSAYGFAHPSRRSRSSAANSWGIADRTSSRVNLWERSVGPLTPHGVCYQKGKELICADPLTGKPLWTRSSLPRGCELFGDDDFLFAAPPGSDQALVFDSRDGRLLDKRKVGRSKERWAVSGRRVLTWSEDRGRLRLRLFDAWTSRDIWSGRFSRGTKVDLIDHEELAVLEKNGDLLILPLDADQPLLKAHLDLASPVEELAVMRAGQQYFVAPLADWQRNAKFTITPAPGGYYTPLVTGPVYAFDRRSGRQQWQSPAMIRQYGMPLTQAADSPLLVFLRHISPKTPTRSQRQTTSILCLDRRDGSVVLDDTLRASSYIFQLTSDPHRQSVTLHLPSKTYSFTLTDRAVPPQPPAHK